MAIIEFYDRVRETTTTTGTGSVTLAGAVTGYRTFQSVLSVNDVTYYCIQSQTVPSEWEVGFGTLSATTTLARTTVIASSNAGAAVNFSAGSKDVFITFAAEACAPVDPKICDLRLTLTSNTPVTTSDVSSSTLYLTPYSGKRISLYSSNRWKLYSTDQISIALTGLTSDTNYDVFAQDDGSGGVELVLSEWADNTTRDQWDISRLDGVYVSPGNLKYLGTFRSTSTTATTDSAASRLLWNYYNRVQKYLLKGENTSTSSWTYSTDTIRPFNGDSGNIVGIVTGLAGSFIEIKTPIASSSSVLSIGAFSGMGLDSTTAFVTGGCVGIATDNTVTQHHSFYFAFIPLGYHYLCGLELGNGTSGNTHTWYAISNTVLQGTWEC